MWRWSDLNQCGGGATGGHTYFLLRVPSQISLAPGLRLDAGSCGCVHTWTWTRIFFCKESLQGFQDFTWTCLSDFRRQSSPGVATPPLSSAHSCSCLVLVWTSTQLKFHRTTVELQTHTQCFISQPSPESPLTWEPTHLRVHSPERAKLILKWRRL